MPHSEFKDGRLLKSKSIAISDLQLGDYRLVVSLREKGSSQVLASANQPLRIVAEKNDLPLYFLSGTQALARPGIAAYMRALEAVAQKNDAAATDYFALALSQNPVNTFAGQSLVLAEPLVAQPVVEREERADVSELRRCLDHAGRPSKSPISESRTRSTPSGSSPASNAARFAS